MPGLLPLVEQMRSSMMSIRLAWRRNEGTALIISAVSLWNPLNSLLNVVLRRSSTRGTCGHNKAFQDKSLRQSGPSLLAHSNQSSYETPADLTSG